MTDTTMVIAPTILAGRHVRLEPLAHTHIPGLVAAAREDPTLYRWSAIPQGVVEMAQYVDTALGWREAGTALPLPPYVPRTMRSLARRASSCSSAGAGPRVTRSRGAAASTVARSATRGCRP